MANLINLTTKFNKSSDIYKGRNNVKENFF